MVMISSCSNLTVAADQRLSRKAMAALLGVAESQVSTLIEPAPYHKKPYYFFGYQYHQFIERQLAALEPRR